jgi:hypothetical protein
MINFLLRTLVTDFNFKVPDWDYDLTSRNLCHFSSAFLRSYMVKSPQKLYIEVSRWGACFILFLKFLKVIFIIFFVYILAQGNAILTFPRL